MPRNCCETGAGDGLQWLRMGRAKAKAKCECTEEQNLVEKIRAGLDTETMTLSDDVKREFSVIWQKYLALYKRLETLAGGGDGG